MPIFSILLPTNKSQRFAEDSILSCLSSSFNDFELLIGVQDWEIWNSISVKNKRIFDDNRLRVIDASQTLNLPGSLNCMIRHAASSFIVRHDDDDLMHPLRLRHLVDNLDVVKQSVVVGQSYKIIDFVRSYCSAVVHPSISDYDNRVKLLTGPCFAHPAITINLNKLNSQYDEEFIYAQDYKLYVDNFEAGYFRGIKGMATYYTAPQKYSSSYFNKRVRQLQLHDMCMLKLWSSLLSVESIPSNIISMFRRKFISSEDIEPLGRLSNEVIAYQAELLDYFHRALNSLQKWKQD